MTSTSSPLPNESLDKSLKDERYIQTWTKFIKEYQKRGLETYPWPGDCCRAVRSHNDPAAIQQWTEWASYVATARASGDV